MTSFDGLMVAVVVVIYLAGVCVTYGMARNASQLPEVWKCGFWPLILALEILGRILLTAFEGFDWLRRALIELGYRWGARLNKGGAT